MYPWILLAVIILLGAGVLLLGLRHRRSRRLQNMFFPGSNKSGFGDKNEKELYQRLLGLVHGREDVARRLIELEQSRNPEKSRQWCLNKAIESLKRERR